MTLTPPRRTRRTHSEAFKQSLIEACEAQRVGQRGGLGERNQRQPVATLDA
ncbi:hypothetical protein [Zoogloea dura]|uniref:Transposase n=1 Tax=Zoogloea dura TaxID=2728840 RepID=A0A848FX39_9RHOO|nr:hypothetical protein [Zoogloea dura]NML24418.1 hypothetical protein [Zoogloea dura]